MRENWLCRFEYSFEQYYKTKDYDEKLRVKEESLDLRRKSRVEAIKEAQGKLALLKETKKKELEEKIESMRTDLVEYDRQTTTNLTKERNEKIRDILLEIEKIVNAYAKKEDYSIILNDKFLIYGHEIV